MKAKLSLFIKKNKIAYIFLYICCDTNKYNKKSFTKITSYEKNSTFFSNYLVI